MSKSGTSIREVAICHACGRPLLRTDDALQPLTDRERVILELLTSGLSNRGIAERMFLSEKTVKQHLHHLYRKLGVAPRVEAALVAVGYLAGTARRRAG